MAAVGLAVGIGVVSALAPAEPGASGAPSAAASSVASRVDAPPGKEQTLPARAPARELEDATARGLSAFGVLAARYPEDARVPLARAGVQLRAKDLEGAVDSLARALELDPSLRQDAQIASTLWITVQNKKSSAQAFALLDGPMGERGRSILNDLVTTPGVKKSVKDDAARALARSPTPRAAR